MRVLPGQYFISIGLGCGRGLDEDWIPEAILFEVTYSSEAAAINADFFGGAFVPSANVSILDQAYIAQDFSVLSAGASRNLHDTRDARAKAMNSSIGFVVVSHLDLQRLERLIGALNRTYDEPPIAIHHDFFQSNIDVSRLSGNIVFIRPHLRTQWADASIVHADLLALRALYHSYDPDWFILLSAADYPIMRGRQVLKELREGTFDLYIDYHLAERYPTPCVTVSKNRFRSSETSWRREAYDRYIAKTIMFPPFIKQQARRPIIIRNELLLRAFLPYTSTWKCYAGDHWFTGNRKVAGILLSETPESRRTLKHLSRRFAPDELFYHTVLGNQSDIRICRDNKRYSFWAEQDAHPKVLEIGDLPSILELRCHFARKFSAN